MAREARETATTSPPGGWRSRRRAERRADVRAFVDQLVWGDAPVGSPTPLGTEKLAVWIVDTFGATLRLNRAKNGAWWLKAAWSSAGARLYVACSLSEELHTFSLHRELAEICVEVLWGLRKASPDVWRG